MYWSLRHYFLSPETQHADSKIEFNFLM
jgi:hypothetical protein